MAMLYTDPKMNILKCKTNEFAEIYEGSTLKDVLFWTGQEYRRLKYKDIHNNFLGKTISPLNLEQKMAFDLLQNPNIPVKLLSGVPGGGKDFLMFLHAWELIQRGKKDKIIFIRNLVPFKDAPEIGFLQGSLQEKIAWGLGPIESILGEEGLYIAQQAGQIEAVNLGFIRGCSWDNAILYVSEG
jgi:predicted ribonuclease YlaK